jgi:hypothetical protein
MAALTADGPTIIDIDVAKDPKGNALRAANLMAQVTPLDNMLNYVPCNGGTRHKVGQIVTEPGTTIRARNEGVAATKEERVAHEEGFCDFHQWGKVDVAVAEDMGNIEAERAKRVRSGFAAIARKKEYTTIYGSKAGSAGKEFDGLQVRFNNLGQNFIDASGVLGGSALASIYLIYASPETVYYIYPENGRKGMRHRAWQMQIEPNQGGVAGANMACFKDEMWQEVGLAVEDPRCVQRIGNIPTGDFSALSGTQLPTIYTTVLDKIMIAHDRFPKDVVGRKFGIANRTVYSGLRRLAAAKSLTAVGWGEALTVLGPRQAIIVDGIPIFECDALTNSESAVTT